MVTQFNSDVAGGAGTLLFQFSKGPESLTKSMERDINVWDIPFQSQNLADDWVSTKITFTIEGYFNETDGNIAAGKGGGTIQQMKDALEDLIKPLNDASQPSTIYLISDFESSTRREQVKIQRVSFTVSESDPLRVKYTVECVAGKSAI